MCVKLQGAIICGLKKKEKMEKPEHTKGPQMGPFVGLFFKGNHDCLQEVSIAVKLVAVTPAAEYAATTCNDY